MDDVLTIEEIKTRFAPDWVLVGDPETNESHELRAGRVLFHSPDPDDVCRKAMEQPQGRYALKFLGEMPENLLLVV